MKSINLRAVKEALDDLDEIGRALSEERPGLEALARGSQAVKRLRSFLDTVPEPSLGMYSALSDIERCLLRQKKPPQLFDDSRLLGQRVASACEDHTRLRLYVTALSKAWQICALNSSWADRKAAGC